MLFAFRVPGQQGTAVSLPVTDKCDLESPVKSVTKRRRAASGSASDDELDDDKSGCGGVLKSSGKDTKKRHRVSLKELREVQAQSTMREKTIQILHGKFRALSERYDASEKQWEEKVTNHQLFLNIC